MPASKDIVAAMIAMKKLHRTGARVGCFAVLAVALAGCASDSQDANTMGRVMVQPDKYLLYNCAQLAQVAVDKQKRARELEALMTKAGPESGGRFVSAIAYKPEYYQVRGEMNELRRSAAEKKCKFVPGAGPAAAPMEAVIPR